MDYKDLLNFYGNCNRAAVALGINRQTVHKWKANGIPFEQQFRIQMRTKGRLKAKMPSLSLGKAA